MSSLTRWVLAHKRTVVIGWIFLTIAGVVAARPGHRHSIRVLGPQQGGLGDEPDDQQQYRGTGGDTCRWSPW